MGKKRRFRLRQWPPLQVLSYLLLRAVAMIVAIFPLASAPGVARFLAALVMNFDRRHRTVAAANLRRTKMTDDIPSMIRRVYEHMALSILEILMIPRVAHHRGMSRYVKLQRLEIVDRILAGGKGFICLIGHVGNWEIGGLAFTTAGYSLHSLARPIENPYIERWLFCTRTSTGQVMISKYRALHTMVDVLKRGEILVIQCDQDAGPAGVFVDFLGLPASTVRSPALLALKYGVPIVPTNFYREKGVNYAVVGDPIDPAEYRGRPDAVRALTQEFTRKIEAFVRMHPEQWNWLHRRWKTPEPAKVTAS